MLKTIIAAAIGAVLGAIALQWQHDSEPPPVPSVQIVPMPVVAPPSPNAEPEMAPLSEPPAPPPRLVVRAPEPVAAKPERSRAVLAMIASRQCAGIGDPAEAIQNTVAFETTITTERMKQIERCAQLEQETR